MRIIFLSLLPFLAFGQKMPLKQSPQPFSPTDLTPLFWYDSRSADMASDGSSWTDRVSGTITITASGTVRPTYNATALNSRPGFVFDGVNDLLVGARITQIQNTQNVTFWMVGKRSTVSHDDGTVNNVTSHVHYDADDKIYDHRSNGSLVSGATVVNTNAFHYSVSLYDGTASGNANRLKIYVDNVAMTLTFSGTVPDHTENNGSSTIKIGSFITVYNAGTICEFGIINRTISGSELIDLNAYLAAKYGL